MTESSAARKTPAGKAAAARPDKAPEHTVGVNDVPDSYVEQGGTVRAFCTCGWNRSERYSRDRLAAVALTRVRVLGDKHTTDPESDA
jgi:hypothetical protein